MKIYLKSITISLILSAFCFGLNAQTILIDNIPRDTSYTLYSAFQKVKKNYPLVKEMDKKLPAGIIAEENISYKTIQNSYRERKLKLNIYRPKNKQVYPVVLMIHGGGWNSGSPEMQRTLAQNLSTRGFATVTVEYRLIPEAIYPAGVEDLEDAVEWIYTHADKYGFDRRKIAVEGASAGGQLASLIGTVNKNGHIKAIVNVDGLTNFVEKETVDRAETARKNGTKMPVDALWLGGTYSEKTEIWSDASPLTHVNEKSAPICFICSSVPRFHNGRDKHISALKRFGIYSEVYSFEGSPHTFWLFYPWHSHTVDLTANFLNKIFGGESRGEE